MKRGYDLPTDAPGVYMPVRTDRGVPFGKFYRPDDLPPELTLSDETIQLAERAMHALGRLDGFRGQVQEADTVFKPLLYKEAEQSSQIEGTQVTTTDMYRATAGGDVSARSRDVQEAMNYVEALQSVSERLLESGRSRENITLDLLLELHRTVMETGQSDEDDPLPGEFRPDYAWIEESTEPWQQSIRFVPPKAEMVESMMEALLAYVQTPSRFPDIVDIALVHYQIETIHPFKDGNGRVGRLLAILMLVASDALTKPLFYMSSYIKANREEYTDRLLAVSEEGAWEEWIQFFVSGMCDQAEEVLGRAKLLLDQYEAYQEAYKSAPESVQRLIGVLFEQPYLTVPMAAERIDMSYPAANTAVDRLVDGDVLIQVEERERNREFVATDVMAIVERDAAELPSPAEVLQ
ncbi:Fic family protein [Natrialba swarupiae]|uniref:Fic family protein n=1 Tax=Natrialba swarupiae TaxID=2448032 RepID=A0A5D5AIW3_9EURY|nr:Fic family protein [Natrialba swarupiae]TYT61719.1 Fic family protein [Natrialba swarupiae]